MKEQAGDQNCQWSTASVSYGFKHYLGALGREQQRALTRLGCDAIEAACGVVLTEADAASANINIGAARGEANEMDGPGGTLAWCQMPCHPAIRQVKLRFDLDETWKNAAATIQTGIEYLLVFLHECCHGLGLPHCETGGPNIMRPVYDPDVRVFGPWDVAQLQRRYGPPKAKTPSTPVIPADQLTIGDLAVLIKDVRYKLVPE